MQKLTLLTLGLALLFTIPPCSDASNTLSPSNELLNTVGVGEPPSEASAQRTATVQLRPINGAFNWEVRARLTSKGNGRFRGRGRFEIPVLGGVVFLPIGGVMQIERNSSGGVGIELRIQGQEAGEGRVRLRFSGSGTGSDSLTGTGESRGAFSIPGLLKVKLDGQAQIVIDFTGAG